MVVGCDCGIFWSQRSHSCTTIGGRWPSLSPCRVAKRATVFDAVVQIYLGAVVSRNTHQTNLYNLNNYIYLTARCKIHLLAYCTASKIKTRGQPCRVAHKRDQSLSDSPRQFGSVHRPHTTNSLALSLSLRHRDVISRREMIQPRQSQATEPEGLSTDDKPWINEAQSRVLAFLTVQR